MSGTLVDWDAIQLHPEPDDEHCPICGEGFSWKGRTEPQRVCGSCRSQDHDPEVDLVEGENYKPGHSSDFPFVWLLLVGWGATLT